MGVPLAWGLGEVVAYCHRKSLTCYETFHEASGLGFIFWSDICNRQYDITFGTWNVRSLYK